MPGTSRPLIVATSTNVGATWTAPRSIETAGDRGYYAAPAISPNGTDAWVVYNAFTTPFRNDTTSPRNLVGVVKHADVAAGAVGAFSEVHRSPGDEAVELGAPVADPEEPRGEEDAVHNQNRPRSRMRSPHPDARSRRQAAPGRLLPRGRTRTGLEVETTTRSTGPMANKEVRGEEHLATDLLTNAGDAADVTCDQARCRRAIQS